jgi:hypothetical protein
MSDNQKGRDCVFVTRQLFHARKAAAALLKMAKATSNPDLAAGLVQAAADLKDQAGELPPPVSAEPPGGAENRSKPGQI